ncbi:ssl1p [Stylonychia lemnae]|uniref:Ssl1p n=1 Tax=Stylonychia lemnae TaxID=5949 RepID=A0A078B5P5_STYLE|nr:ssl1p [Stylonychia lemnae]|eukprot:CDW88627.1 ssl1p [Stylonychia lemnae]
MLGSRLVSQNKLKCLSGYLLKVEDNQRRGCQLAGNDRYRQEAQTEKRNRLIQFVDQKEVAHQISDCSYRLLKCIQKARDETQQSYCHKKLSLSNLFSINSQTFVRTSSWTILIRILYHALTSQQHLKKELSFSQDLIDKICRFTDFEGNASLQNSLELCIENFQTVPSYAKKEILIIYCSITNCDPGNVFETFDKLKSQSISASVISLSSSLFILQKRLLVPKETLEDLMFRNQQENMLIKMGFPMKQLLKMPTFCSCHHEIRFLVYNCPNCLAPSCELSSFCKVCSIMLVSAAHLSRTAQNNQSLANFTTLKDYLIIQKTNTNESQANENQIIQQTSQPDQQMTDESKSQQQKGQEEQIHDQVKLGEIVQNNMNKTIGDILTNNSQYHCNGCSKKLDATFDNPENVVCTKCKKLYCLDCDIFIHETLLSCPTCQLLY